MYLTRRCRYGLMIYNRKDVWVGRSLELYGEFSEGEVALFRAVIKPRHTVLDIGANIGCHTVALSRMVPNGSVLAFEPERFAFYALGGNVAVNNLRNVFVFHQAIGDRVGALRVPELDYEKTDNFGGLTLDADYSNCPHYPVVVNTIDSISLTGCDFVKIDVEGMERSVLLGAAKTIEEFKPLLYVEDDRAEKSAALREHIWSLGYDIYVHEPPLFNKDNFDGEVENVFVARTDGGLRNVVSCNLFCHSKDRPCPLNPADFGLRRVDPQPVPTSAPSP